MKLFNVLSSTLATLALVVADVPPIQVVGNKFYFSNNGSQFLMRGIAYQQNTANSTDDLSFIDPLADETACQRDVKYFQQLNTNTLRVYAVNASLNHDKCMKIFADAGIYIIADLSEPDASVNRDSPEWNLDLYERYTTVVDMFANYSNVIGFFAGNEVTNNKTNTDASAFVKAAVRDTKAYIRTKNYRQIPVGYSSNDDPDTRVAIGDYFACGEGDEKADFFGINMYEWCGSSTFATSGYKDRTDDYKNLSIPIFFSEYGCNEVKPRKFEEVGTIYSSEMTDIWSGGIVYMYFQEENDYGLVSVSGNNVKTLDDFSYYSSEINNISPTLASIASGVTTSSGSGIACPATSDTWAAATNLPPTPDKDTCDCVASTLECVVADSVKSSSYASLFGQVCGSSGVDCGIISANGTSGVYGGLSFCSDKDKLSFVLNQYYIAQKKSSSACDFDGQASINKSASAASSCSSKISSATQAVSTPTSGSSGSRASGSASGSQTSSSSSSSSTKKSSANISAKQMGKVELVAIAGLVTSFIGGASFILF